MGQTPRARRIVQEQTLRRGILTPYLLNQSMWYLGAGARLALLSSLRAILPLPPQSPEPRPDMTRQPKNEAFARTSFLQGANAAYIEEMQAQYERNPGLGERRVAPLLRQPAGGAAARPTATAMTGRRGRRPLEQIEPRATASCWAR